MTREHGEAIGSLLSALVACGAGVEKVVLTQDSLEVSMSKVDRGQRETGKPGRSGRKYEFGGEALTVGEWAEKFGVSYAAMHSRLTKHGSPYGRTGKAARESDKLV